MAKPSALARESMTRSLSVLQYGQRMAAAAPGTGRLTPPAPDAERAARYWPKPLWSKPRGPLFAEAEASEDAIEQILGVVAAVDGGQLPQRRLQIGPDQLTGQITGRSVGRSIGCRGGDRGGEGLLRGGQCRAHRRAGGA